jgi:hypothetical protein
MQEVRLSEIILPYGPLIPTGSYFLNVMVYPDLDVMIPPVSIEQLFQIGGQLAGAQKVYQVVFEKSRDPELAGGLYLKSRIEHGNWDRPWKIDIWSLNSATITQRLTMMQKYKDKLTDELREQIIRYKLSIMTPQHRTPMYSSYWVYKAFLDEGLRDYPKVTQYLIANGIQVA